MAIQMVSTLPSDKKLFTEGWEFDGADWENPDPYDVRYWMALELAIINRYTLFGRVNDIQILYFTESASPFGMGLHQTNRDSITISQGIKFLVEDCKFINERRLTQVCDFVNKNWNRDGEYEPGRGASVWNSITFPLTKIPYADNNGSAGTSCYFTWNDLVLACGDALTMTVRRTDMPMDGSIGIYVNQNYTRTWESDARRHIKACYKALNLLCKVEIGCCRGEGCVMPQLRIGHMRVWGQSRRTFTNGKYTSALESYPLSLKTALDAAQKNFEESIYTETFESPSVPTRVALPFDSYPQVNRETRIQTQVNPNGALYNDDGSFQTNDDGSQKTGVTFETNVYWHLYDFSKSEFLGLPFNGSETFVWKVWCSTTNGWNTITYYDEKAQQYVSWTGQMRSFADELKYGTNVDGSAVIDGGKLVELARCKASDIKNLGVVGGTVTAPTIGRNAFPATWYASRSSEIQYAFLDLGGCGGYFAAPIDDSSVDYLNGGGFTFP